jgi:hypothetical protein
MKRHPSLPQGKNVQGISDVKRKAIEKNIAETRADDKPSALKYSESKVLRGRPFFFA